jgi:hypothetical protein
VTTALGVAALVALTGAAVYVAVSTGSLTLDTGIGRRTRPLPSRRVTIRAPRERVFDLVALPYLSAQPPRALRDKIEVLERGSDLVVAAHRTRLSLFTAVTVEAVRFERPEAVTFRLLRGPVPYVAERFSLVEDGDVTHLDYAGTLGTDFWWLGRAWGALVARPWMCTVDASLAELKEAAER